MTFIGTDQKWKRLLYVPKALSLQNSRSTIDHERLSYYSTRRSTAKELCRKCDLIGRDEAPTWRAPQRLRQTLILVRKRIPS